jgi:hypothetical protein
MSDTRYQLWVDGEADNDLTAAAAYINVTESVRGASALTMRLVVDIDKGAVTFAQDPRLEEGADKPISLVVTVDGESSVIFHGVITEKSQQLMHGGAGSSIDITCSDHRALMDRDHTRRELHSHNASDVVLAILNRGDYPFDDVIVEDSSCDLFDSRDDQFVQTASDLAVVRRMAGLAGVEFWLDWELSGDRIRETAHFESQPPRNEGGAFGGLGGLVPPIPLLAPASSPKLTLNTGNANNTMLQFSRRRMTEVPTSSGAMARENSRDGRKERSSVSGPSQAPLGSTLKTSSKNRAWVVTAGGVSLANAASTAALNDAAWAIRANVTTSATACCGGLIRPRQVVKVEGTGEQDDGDYFVWSVSHHINLADYQLEIELRRNAEGES